MNNIAFIIREENSQNFKILIGSLIIACRAYIQAMKAKIYDDESVGES